MLTVTAFHVLPRARAFVACVIALGLAGCATPGTDLQNPKTGQDAPCGGDRVGSWTGGGRELLYYLGNNDDDHCVQK